MSTSQGHRRRRARDRGPAAAGAAALPVPAPQAAQGHRVRPRGRHHPGPLRRVRPDRRRRRRQAGARRAAARPRAHLPRQPGRSEPDDLAVEAARFRPAFRHLALLVQVPGVDLDGAHGGREGRAARRRRAGHPRRARRRRAAWLADFAPDRYRVGSVQDALPDGAADLDEAQRALPGRPGRRPRASERPGGRRRLAGPHLPHRPGARACPRQTPSRPSTSRSSAGPTGPRAGWLLASLEPGFVVDACGGRVRRRAVTAMRQAEVGMSVGLQRLRDDAARHPRGRRRQGRGPGRRRRRRSRSTAAPARLLGEVGQPARRAQAAITERSARPSRAAPMPDGPEVASCARSSTELGARIDGLRRAPGRGRGRARGAAAAHPQPARPGRARRRRGGQRHRAHVGRARRPTHAERAGSAGRTGRSARRWACSTSPPAPRSPAPASPSTAAPAPRSSARSSTSSSSIHTREHGMTEIWPPAAGQRGLGARHGPDPGQGRPDVRRDARRAVPGAHRRGAGHQHPPRRDHRGGPSCPSATSPTRPASGARPARPAQGRAASCASTSSTRSRWSASSARTTRTRRSSG